MHKWHKKNGRKQNEMPKKLWKFHNGILKSDGSLHDSVQKPPRGIPPSFFGRDMVK